jgi:hypothetical protein
MTAVYRFYTERKDNLAELTCRYFDGATLLHATGIWKGDTESSIVIEVIATSSHADISRVEQLARDIVDTNAQQCVLITVQSAHMLSRLDVTPYGIQRVS